MTRSREVAFIGSYRKILKKENPTHSIADPYPGNVRDIHAAGLH
jgi:hypothetical protein